MVTLERPQLLLIAGLAALGAVVALGELLAGLDRLRMAATTAAELEQLPTYEEEGESES